jgi:pimeloyl-ACP methyl ester carboxylesterase
VILVRGERLTCRHEEGPGTLLPVRSWRRLAILACTGLWIGLAPAGASAQGSDGSGVRFARGDFAGLVGIGDARKMYLECHGRGRPTVILEAGLRSRGDFWMPTEETRGTAVVAGVARFTRVCILDRPGTTLGNDEFSRSDPVPMPRSARDAVADLHALLRAARVRGPYVLGGHSTGGLIVRLYASTYPRQVVGLVQVDALNEFVQRRWAPWCEPCGLGFTRAQMAAFDELNNGPLPELAGYKDLEQVLFRPSFAQMRRAAKARPRHRMPVTVISRGVAAPPLPGGLPGGLTSAVHERAWRGGQAKLVEVMGARHVIARRSQHYIMFSEPGVIVRAIRGVVRAVRR